MPKRGLSKSTISIKNELYQAAKYHWEFKRRNLAYRLWWQQGSKATLKPDGWDEQFNPDIPFDELIRHGAKKYLSLVLNAQKNTKLKRLLAENKHAISTSEFLFVQEILPKGVEHKFDRACLTIKIDFNKIKSISALRKYVSLIIEDIYSFNIKANLLSAEKEVQVGRSKNLKRDFDKILEAGDLKQSGKTYAQIATVMYPRLLDPVTGKAPDSSVREVKRYVKDFRRLVDKGYLGITFP